MLHIEHLHLTLPSGSYEQMAKLYEGVVFKSNTPGTSNPSPPPIGEVWPGQGGVYVGLERARGDVPLSHLIVSERDPGKDLIWQAGLDWAADLVDEGHSDFMLPDKGQGALLYANVPELFDKSKLYWLRTQFSEYLAFCQGFYTGYQYHDAKEASLSVRAVRRLIA
ncbi:MAG: hypothetical protein ABI605_11050 [Rhizobacter sp.]